MGLLSRMTQTPPRFDPASYWADRHAAHAGSLAAVGHRQLTEEQNAAQYEIKRQKLLEALDRFFPDPRGRALLDAGCGTGVLSEAFADHGFEVTGVDFCETAVQAARRRVPKAKFIVSPLDELRLETRFEVVTVIDVLLHVVEDEKWRRTVANLAGHLKPDGAMLILDSMKEAGEADATHCQRRSNETWQQVFRGVGLELLYSNRLELPCEGALKDVVIAAKGSLVTQCVPEDATREAN